MKKLTDLRAHLLANVPNLKRNPDKLLTFIEDGSIEFWEGPNLSHLYSFPVQLIITDYSGPVDDIILPVLSWLKIREPGHDPKNTLRFEAELLKNNSYDIAITVQVTERVIVKATDAGLDVEHILPEPPMEMDATEWQIIMDLHGLEEDVDFDD